MSRREPREEAPTGKAEKPLAKQRGRQARRDSQRPPAQPSAGGGAMAACSHADGELDAVLDVLDGLDPPDCDEGPQEDMANGYGLVTDLANDAIERESARAAEDAEDARTPRRNFGDRPRPG